MRRLKIHKLRIRMVPRMARRRRASRTKTVYRRARKSYRRNKFGIRGRSGGGLMSQAWNAFKDGQAYRIVASKFAPQFAPIAQAYGEYKGGGLPGLLINELVINGLVGTPGILGNINLLGGILPGLGGGSTGSGMSGAV